VTPQDNPQW